MQRLKLLIAAVVFLSPLASWAFFKPVRVLTPELAGLKCPTPEVCIDDIQHVPEAMRLRSDAVAFVEGKAGPLEHRPRMLFCTTARCEKTFGFTSNAAYTVGSFGIVIGRRGWKDYIARHELVHHLQAEHIGSLRMLISTPTWLIEGMAYSWSADPRRPLPTPLEEYRQSYEAWEQALPKGESVWVAARNQ